MLPWPPRTWSQRNFVVNCHGSGCRHGGMWCKKTQVSACIWQHILHPTPQSVYWYLCEAPSELWAIWFLCLVYQITNEVTNCEFGIALTEILIAHIQQVHCLPTLPDNNMSNMTSSWDSNLIGISFTGDKVWDNLRQRWRPKWNYILVEQVSQLNTPFLNLPIIGISLTGMLLMLILEDKADLAVFKALADTKPILLL